MERKKLKMYTSQYDCTVETQHRIFLLQDLEFIYIYIYIYYFFLKKMFRGTLSLTQENHLVNFNITKHLCCQHTLHKTYQTT
jgi:hypothetical protein